MINKNDERLCEMSILLRGAALLHDGKIIRGDAVTDSHSFFSVDAAGPLGFFDAVVDCDGLFIVPGLVDVHVHLREPGFSYKETIASGTRAALESGYCALCCMPNVQPAPDDADDLEVMLELIRRDAQVQVVPFGTITRRREGRAISDMEAMAPFVAGFSDDGSGVDDEDLMRQAMQTAKRLGKPIAAHCEVKSLVAGGCIHAGRYASVHSLPGISSESEWRMVERDLKLCAQTGARYHVCHVSTAESVALIRDAKRAGLPVTCETAPHYLLLCDDDLKDEGRFKMNPPLRSARDRDALIAGALDGTIDVIATDHAPHSAEEKSKGLLGSAMGVSGLETAFPALYTGLVRTGIMTMERLVTMMSAAPAEIFGIDTGGSVAGFRLDEGFTVDPSEFKSLGKSTPFEGRELYGRAELSVIGGIVRYEKKKAGA